MSAASHGAALTDKCIEAAHVAFHFIYRRIFVPAAELPWRLVRGDIAGNLERLASDDCPEEPVSKNMWILMNEKGFNKDQLVATVRMLGEAGWTSLPAEQQHASLAMLHKWHPYYDTKTLVSRSFLLQMYKLLPRESKEERQADRLAHKLQRVLRAAPEKVRGRQMMVGAMISICQGKHDAGQPGYVASMDRIAKQCMTRHSAMWAQQTLAQQAEWHQRARLRASARAHLLGVQWQVLQNELAEVEAEIEKSRLATTALTMSSASLNESDMELIDVLWHQPGFADHESMAMRRASVGIAPGIFRSPPSDIVVWQREDPTMPAWAHDLVKFRDTFNGSALRIQRRAGGCEYWKLVFAIQSPKYYLGMCRLSEALPPSPHDLSAPPLHLDFNFVFHINYAACVSAAEVTVGPHDEPRNLFGLRHEGGTRVVSDEQPILLDYIVQGESLDFGGVEEVVAAQAKSEKADSTFEQLVATMPWLDHLDFKEGLTAGEAGGATAAAGDAELDEDAIWAGLAALEKARIAVRDESALTCGKDFVCRVRGGVSEILKSGEAVHAVQGQCTNKEAAAWARSHAQTTFKATFLSIGQAQAQAMVRSW